MLKTLSYQTTETEMVKQVDELSFLIRKISYILHDFKGKI